ncbi:MAG TPA: [acyl-carrier-protein] S-malonyltransferase [Kosmotogaceae bacterium]|nr:MAG: Malonyl CoA-acyl carrier protein transacylase [Thermotogales bacterium 46_20]HAA86131.1 [acyl-carrier-protein] S-malonyltransferase [Kosmotogaceae bacterium]
MIAWMFPGQGAQYVGMAGDLLSSDDTVCGALEDIEERLGVDIARIMQNGPEEQLRLTENAQPAILLHSVLSARRAIEKGFRPDFLLGQSLGEYSALVVSGAMDLADAVEIVRLRGKLMQQVVPEGKGAMAAIIGLGAEATSKICNEIGSEDEICISNYNAPEQVVVSGLREYVEKAAEKAGESGARKVVMLGVSAPFHTKLLAPAGESLRKRLQMIEIRPPSVPVISNVSAQPVPQSKEGIIELLVRQVSSPVRWEESIKYLVGNSVDSFVEFGPGASLSGLVRKIDNKAKAHPTDRKDIAAVMNEVYPNV